MSTKPTALVTGANKGIGFAIVEKLAILGYKVWLGSRDEARGTDAVMKLRQKNLDVELLIIDVSSDESTTNAFSELSKSIEKLDVLVNNAGINLDPTAPPSLVKMQDMKTIYEVNVFGPVRVTQTFLPLLKAAKDANVVMISSGLGSLALVNNSSSIYSTANLLAYNSSKTALNAIMVSFAKELIKYGIKVNAVEPGNVATDLNNNTGASTPKEGAYVAVTVATVRGKGSSGMFYGTSGLQPW